MVSSLSDELQFEFPPLVRVYKNGHVDRLLGTESIPAGSDPQTGVLSKDVSNIIPGTEVYVRIYIPSNINESNKRIPVLVYFHGGGFCLFTPSSPEYHNYINTLVNEAQIIAVSVHYRRAPEHRLPVAFDDSLIALEWIISHRTSNGPDAWLNNHADFGRVFLAGDSSGANIAHNVAMTVGKPDLRFGADILGIALVHPYFWGSVRTGSELVHLDRVELEGKWWPFVCPSRPNDDDPWINPIADGAPSLKGLGCKKVLVCVAEKDMMKDRGMLYYKALDRSGWKGTVEIEETQGEDHAFHLYNVQSEKAKELMKRLVAFFNSN